MYRTMVTPTTVRVAAEVRAELGRQKMSIRELAAKLEQPRSNVSRRLNGEQPLTIDDITAIARALGVPLAALLPKQDAPATAAAS